MPLDALLLYSLDGLCSFFILALFFPNGQDREIWPPEFLTTIDGVLDGRKSRKRARPLPAFTSIQHTIDG